MQSAHRLDFREALSTMNHEPYLFNCTIKQVLNTIVNHKLNTRSGAISHIISFPSTINLSISIVAYQFPCSERDWENMEHRNVKNAKMGLQ